MKRQSQSRKLETARRATAGNARGFALAGWFLRWRRKFSDRLSPWLAGQNPIAKTTVLGFVAGALVTSIYLPITGAWLAELLVRAASERAVDDAQLGVSRQLSLIDFQAPHTQTQLDELSVRLGPSLAPLIAPGSGVVRVNVLAIDGTIIYSDAHELRGRVLAPSEKPLLAKALGGNAASELSSLSTLENEDLRARYSSVIEVYVPIRLDGQVVGAYELYQDSGIVRWIFPLAWVTLAITFAVLANLATRVLPRSRPHLGGPNGRRELHASGSQSQGFGSRLTPRELEVLRSMATSHSYQEIAALLMVSQETVRTHAKSILHKLGQRDRTQAVLTALRTGLLDLEVNEDEADKIP
jgi:DNA-binding CsgD family transcriptional regulator